MKKTKFYVGGQAVLEGVMMRGPKITATAVRKPDGEIVVDTSPTTSIADRYTFLKWPLLRGSVALIESLMIGMRALSFSAQAMGEEEEALSNKEIAMTMAFSMGMGILLFMVLPTYAAKFVMLFHVGPVALNFVEGVLRIGIFLLYMAVISQMKDIQRLYEYHGAEHMTIHAYEAEEPLTVENIEKKTRLHPRCGTNFLLLVMLVSVFVFSFLGWPSLLERIVSRIVLLPLIAGISYEIIRYAGRSDAKWIYYIILPGLWLQNMTTKRPDASQIEVAVAALEAVRPSEEDMYE